MKQITVYLKCDRSAEVQAQDVFLKDVAEVRCQDPVLQAKLKTIKVQVGEGLIIKSPLGQF